MHYLTCDKPFLHLCGEANLIITEDVLDICLLDIWFSNLLLRSFHLYSFSDICFYMGFCCLYLV